MCSVQKEERRIAMGINIRTIFTESNTDKEKEEKEQEKTEDNID